MPVASNSVLSVAYSARPSVFKALVLTGLCVMMCGAGAMRIPDRETVAPQQDTRPSDFKFSSDVGDISKPHFEPDAYMDVTQLITSKGYPCEQHYVTTEDGFILTLQRIPHGRSLESRTLRGNGGELRPVVFLQHGLVGSSLNFLENGADESLAYILADAGADVWLGNTRGNHFAMNHTTLLSSDIKFWEWSFNEMARFDLPAMHDYVLKATGRQQLHHVGHSQGCTILLIEASRNSQIAPKVKHFYALAPATRVRYSTSAVKKFVKSKDIFALLLNALNHGSTDMGKAFFPVAGAVCDAMGYSYCRDLMFQVVGGNTKSFNTSHLPVYVAHNPQPTSTNTLLHWMQLMGSGEFQEFDEGSPEDNMRRYGKPSPPLYDLSTFNISTSVYYGGNDTLVAPRDVEWLMTQFPVARRIFVPYYEHMDFAWAIDASKTVYNDIINSIFSRP